MPEVFFYGCPHIGHSNIYSVPFTLLDGVTRLRPFTTAEEADAVMLERYNALVGPKDKVYWMGDIAFGNRQLATVGAYNGTKILIKGNHDNLKPGEYLKYFKDIRATHQFDKMLLSHFPVHPSSLGKWKVNIHAHTHARKIYKGTQDTDGWLDAQDPDTRYLCVCVEQTNYAPMPLAEVRKRFNL